MKLLITTVIIRAPETVLAVMIRLQMFNIKDAILIITAMTGLISGRRLLLSIAVLMTTVIRGLRHGARGVLLQTVLPIITRQVLIR